MIGSMIMIGPKTCHFLRDAGRFERNNMFLDQSLSWKQSSLEPTQDRDDWFQDRDWSKNLLFLPKHGSFRKKQYVFGPISILEPIISGTDPG